MRNPIVVMGCIGVLLGILTSTAFARAGMHPLDDGVPMLAPGEPAFLTQPYLQNPSNHSVNVVWLTNFRGVEHTLLVEQPQTHFFWAGQNGYYPAHSRQLFRLFEDGASRLEVDIEQVHRRPVFRHEAVAFGLQPGKQYRYWVESRNHDGQKLRTGPFTLQALPREGEALEILLTSDQQERFNSLANYQKVSELFPSLDAIFFAGDLANHPRRGSEWFDNYLSSWHENPTASRPAFFPAMQGTFKEMVPESPYAGAPLMQNVPLFPSVANHEVSGRFRPNEAYTLNGDSQIADINSMFGDSHPRWYAEHKYNQVKGEVNPYNNPIVKEQWIRDHSNDFEVYRDLFTLPDDGPEGEAYYSKKIGDVFLISMNVSRIWRNWNIGADDRSKFVEMLMESNNPDAWGFGEHIFTPFAEGTQQYRWLKKTLKSRDFRRSKYRVVMFHQSAHGLGDNAVPVLTDPVMHIEYTDEEGLTAAKRILMPQDNKLRIQRFKTEVEPLLGNIQSIRYEYPIESDYFHRDVEPLLQKYGVQLVLTGHSHVWNRSRSGNLNMMETSNVGNCYGGYWKRSDGSIGPSGLRIGGAFAEELEMGAEFSRWDPKNYPRTGDPHGRKPIYPNIVNPMEAFGVTEEPVPYVCSNNITVFTILDTAAGAVRSFAFDVNDPESEVIEFDRFSLVDAGEH